jgi:vesicle transport protein SEC22
MIHLTMIARVYDGLPLTASLQDENLTEYQNKAKAIFRKLNNQSAPQMSIEHANMTFHYQIDQGVCYLCLADNNFSRKLCFAYLQDLQSEFFVQYGNRIDKVTRPYHFIEFDTYIQKAKKTVMDTRNHSAIKNVASELQDVQKIMVANLDEVLQRGTALSDIQNKSSSLASFSAKYREDAKKINQRSNMLKVGGALSVILWMIWYLFL